MMNQPRANGHGEAKCPDFPELVASAGDVTTVVDLTGRYLYCSAALEEVFGWEPNKLVGRLEVDLAHADDAPTLLGARRQTPSTGPPPSHWPTG